MTKTCIHFYSSSREKLNSLVTLPSLARDVRTLCEPIDITRLCFRNYTVPSTDFSQLLRIPEMKAPGVSLNMNDDVYLKQIVWDVYGSRAIFSKCTPGTEGTLIPPSLSPLLPRTIARQVNKLFIYVQRGTYDAALQLPCLSRSEVEPCTSKKGKACHSLRWPPRRAGTSSNIGIFEHKNARHSKSACIPHYVVSHRQIIRACSRQFLNI